MNTSSEENRPTPLAYGEIYLNDPQKRRKTQSLVLDALKRRASHHILALGARVLPLYRAHTVEARPREWPPKSRVPNDLFEAIESWTEAFNGWEFMGEVALETLRFWDRAERHGGPLEDRDLALQMPTAVADGPSRERRQLPWNAEWARAYEVLIEASRQTGIACTSDQHAAFAETNELFSILQYDPSVLPAQDWMRLLHQAGENHIARIHSAEIAGASVTPVKRRIQQHCEWFVLYEFERMSYEEIAAEYELQSNATIWQAVNKIRDWLGCPTRAKSGRPPRKR